MPESAASPPTVPGALDRPLPSTRPAGDDADAESGLHGEAPPGDCGPRRHPRRRVPQGGAPIPPPPPPRARGAGGGVASGIHLSFALTFSI